jgi:hypothetical protein
MKNQPRAAIGIGIAMLFFAALACNLTPPASSTGREATAAAISTTLAGGSTETPGVNATPNAGQAEATATQSASASNSTQVVQSTSASVDQSATQEALAPILGELSLYGVDPQGGQLGWIQPPLTLEIDQFHGSKFDNKFPMVTAKDFVLAADITWDTEYGGSGCGYVFRSDGNQQAPNQYMVASSRLAEGHVVFAVMAQGQLVVGKDFYANGLDPKFNANNGATNRLTVVGRGTNFTIYSNGTKLGDASPNDPLPTLALPDPPAKPFNLADPNAAATYQRAVAKYKTLVSQLKNEYNQRVKLWKTANKDFEDGFVSMGAMAESGRTRCEFNNAWLWLIGPQ